MKKLACLLLTLSVALCACGSVRSGTYANANRYKIGSFTYSADAVEAVEINWVSGRVELKESAQAQLAVTETTEGLTQDQQMRWWLDGKTLRIQYWKSGYSASLSNKEKRVQVEIPKDVDLQVSVTSGRIVLNNHQVRSLALNMTSGSAVTGAVNAEKASFHCTSGSVKTGPLRIQKELTAECTSGVIEIENAMAERVSLKSTSGKIQTGPLDAETTCKAETTSGSVKVDAVSAKEVNISSTSGNVRVGLYQCAKANIRCTSGDVHASLLHGTGATVDFNSASGRLNGGRKGKDYLVVGSGSCALKISTTSGDAKVSEKEK